MRYCSYSRKLSPFYFGSSTISYGFLPGTGLDDGEEGLAGIGAEMAENVSFYVSNAEVPRIRPILGPTELKKGHRSFFLRDYPI